jgi:hypothetical protein
VVINIEVIVMVDIEMINTYYIINWIGSTSSSNSRGVNGSYKASNSADRTTSFSTSTKGKIIKSWSLNRNVRGSILYWSISDGRSGSY